MATVTSNGKVERWHLSDQLARRDLIIDALPEAVAEAAQAGTIAAIQEAVRELLGNPNSAGR